MNTISELMIKDHLKLIGFLKDLEYQIKHRDKQLEKTFRRFEWNLEKHIFVEERVIFTSYNPKKVDESYDSLIDMSRQHTEILDTLKDIKNDLKETKPVKIIEFRQMLLEHKNYEENYVYPLLDSELGDGEKRLIIERINEII
jgi:iron-sulfur cluster repair protein YtfE (RIC family)